MKIHNEHTKSQTKTSNEQQKECSTTTKANNTQKNTSCKSQKLAVFLFCCFEQQQNLICFYFLFCRGLSSILSFSAITFLKVVCFFFFCWSIAYNRARAQALTLPPRFSSFFRFLLVPPFPFRFLLATTCITLLSAFSLTIALSFYTSHPINKHQQP